MMLTMALSVLLQLHVDLLAHIVRRHAGDPNLAVRGEVAQAVLPGALAHHGHHHGVEHGLPNLACCRPFKR